MLDEGLLEVTPQPAVAAYAIHVGPGRPGTVWTRRGVILAGMSELRVVVRGRGGHGSAPHAALDPVPVLAEIVTALHTHVTRRYSVFDPVVLSVTQLAAAEASNVIPETATLTASVRTLSAATLDRVRAGVLDLVHHIARAHGMTAEAELVARYPITRNDPQETDFVLATAARVLGGDAVSAEHDPLMGSEDFSKILERVPGTLMFFGTTPPELDPASAPDVHSPAARFTDSALDRHAALLAQLAIGRLATSATATS